ncbi:MAG: M48 family metalloprotease [Gammaproteobacteria bacterium]
MRRCCLISLVGIPVYSRKQELDADRAAVALLYRAGYEAAPNIMMATLSRLEYRHARDGGGFFDTHPSFNDRMEAIEREVQKDSSRNWNGRRGRRST